MKKTIPSREDQNKEFTWDLSGLYKSEKQWEIGFNELQSDYKPLISYEGRLAESPEILAAYLEKDNSVSKKMERLHYYAFLRLMEDQGNSDCSGRTARIENLYSKISGELSFFRPELLGIPDDTMTIFLENEKLKPFIISLQKILHFKAHTLSGPEENLLARQGELFSQTQKSFSALTDVDMQFQPVKTDEGEKPLTHSSLMEFLINPNQKIREKAYRQFYAEFDDHKNTIASLFSGSVKQDVFLSEIKKYDSPRHMALYKDKVEEKVYDNLIKTVHEFLPILHEYYEIRCKKLKLTVLNLWDIRVPLVSDIKVTHTYEEAVETIEKALKPLGNEYAGTLKNGLNSGWVDRYENKGKRSGAFSAGSFHGEPYILMNFKEEVLNDVFTLVHEGGHSMHSWYSVRNNPFQHYNYTIFEAEVASTFNEQLLAHHLMKDADAKGDRQLKTYLVNMQIDAIIGTIFRQTMFAEYEQICHDLQKKGTPLTLEVLRSEYRKLLSLYFGPKLELQEESDLEGLRIPHFYRAFYVYKYATGLSAAIALSEKVLKGGDKERDDYLSFLKSGGSRYPLESLKLAGVDMSEPLPVRLALDKFTSLVEQLKNLL